MTNKPFEEAAAEVLEQHRGTFEALAKNEASEKQAELSPEDQVYVDFCKKHRDRCGAWIKANGNMNFPIMHVKGELVWLNRAQRRKLVRQSR